MLFPDGLEDVLPQDLLRAVPGEGDVEDAHPRVVEGLLEQVEPCPVALAAASGAEEHLELRRVRDECGLCREVMNDEVRWLGLDQRVELLAFGGSQVRQEIEDAIIHPSE